MRILLIAYEFPPIISGQSLRWFYLANEFAKLGVEVHVLCPDMPALPPFSEGLHRGITVHRTWAGPYVGVSQSIYLRLSRLKGGRLQEEAAPVDPAHKPTPLSQMYRSGRRVLDQVIFPDLRSEWAITASIRLASLLRTNAYSAVVASHEPGVSLMLGLLAQRVSGLALIADLGDPVVAPHAPRWRQRFDLAFEAKVLKQVDAAVVTTEAAAELFMNRHGLGLQQKFACITQGFPSRSHKGKGKGKDKDKDKDKDKRAGPPRADALKMVYTGNFYEDFRSPAQLAIALKSLKDLNLQLDFYGSHSAYHPLFDGLECATFHGAVDHHTCLEVQQDCDVLLSLGNRQAFQVPGKVYEYLGANVPILHIAMSPTDEAGLFISNLGVGWSVPNEAGQLAQAIRNIHAQWLEGRLQSALSRNEAAIAEFSWSRRATRYLEMIERTVKALSGKALA